VLVKAFQVFHPTNFELLHRRAGALREGRHYFSVKSWMNRRRRRVGFHGPTGRPTVSFGQAAAPSRAERAQKSSFMQLLQNAPRFARARARARIYDSGDRRSEKRLFKETRMNNVSALAPIAPTCFSSRWKKSKAIVPAKRLSSFGLPLARTR